MSLSFTSQPQTRELGSKFYTRAVNSRTLAHLISYERTAVAIAIIPSTTCSLASRLSVEGIAPASRESFLLFGEGQRGKHNVSCLKPLQLWPSWARGSPALKPLQFCLLAGPPCSVNSLQQNHAAGPQSSAARWQRPLCHPEEPQVRQKSFSGAAHDRSPHLRAPQCSERTLAEPEPEPEESEAGRASGHSTDLPRWGEEGGHTRTVTAAQPRSLGGGPGTPPVEPQGRGRPPQGGAAGRDSWVLSAPRLALAAGEADGGGGGRRGRPNAPLRTAPAPRLDGAGGRPGGTWPTPRQSERPRP